MALNRRFLDAIAALLRSAQARGEVADHYDAADIVMAANMGWGALENHGYEDRQATAPRILAFLKAGFRP